MKAKYVVATAIVVIVIVIVLGASFGVFLPTPVKNSTYKEPTSAIHASLGKSASAGGIALKLNSITDASNPATRDTWVALNLNATAYNHTLTPPPGDQYLIANVTVTNVQQAQIPFTHAAFVLVTPDGTAYYANYAVCDKSCAAQALKNRTLSETFSSDVYVLFSVPAGTNAEKIVYTASNPPIVMSSV